MRISPGADRQGRASGRGAVHGAALPAVLTALLLIAAVGCALERSERKSTAEKAGAGSKATTAAAGKGGGSKTATASRSDKPSATGESRRDASPAGRTTRVRLTWKGCVQFEPTWASVHVGQSLTWDSDLTTPVTIHVSSGAFDRTEFVVRPGQVASTGPARSAGSFSIWAEPAACQGVSRGGQGTGPGVMVEGEAERY